MRTFSEIEATRPKVEAEMWDWYLDLPAEAREIWRVGDLAREKAQEKEQAAYARKLWKFLLREGEVEPEDKEYFDPSEWSDQYRWDENMDDFVEIEEMEEDL